MAKVKSQFDGQISMFDLMELSFTDTLKDRACPVSFEERRKKVLEKKEDYLQKGDILLTLAKERLEKELKHLTLSEFDKSLQTLTFHQMMVLRKQHPRSHSASYARFFPRSVHLLQMMRIICSLNRQLIMILTLRKFRILMKAGTALPCAGFVINTDEALISSVSH